MQHTNVILQNNIKKQLSERGISVRDLERRSGLKYSVVQNILHGRSKNPTINVLQKIADELGCTVQELIDHNGRKHISDVSKESQADLQKPWNGDLYIDVAKVVFKIFQKNGIKPLKEKALLCVDEVYHYSLGLSDKADARFAEWVIDKFLSK